MSDEGKLLLCGLCALTLSVLIVPSEEEPAATFANGNEIDIVETNTIEQNENKVLEIEGLGVAEEDTYGQNPFTYGHETKDGKMKVETRKTPADLQSEHAPQVQANSSETWKLTGVIIGDERTAILSDNRKSTPLHIGDAFDGKTVTAIETDYILYSSASGEGRLALSP